MSFVGLLGISTMTLIINYFTRKGFSTVFVLLVIVFILTLAYGLHTGITKSIPASITLHQWLLLMVGGIASVIGNFALFEAQAKSPNPGLVLTIFGLQAGIVAVGLSSFLKIE